MGVMVLFNVDTMSNDNGCVLVILLVVVLRGKKILRMSSKKKCHLPLESVAMLQNGTVFRLLWCRTTDDSYRVTVR